MTNTIDNVGALYKALRQKGFSDIGTEDIFRNKLQDENNRKQLYDALRKNGYDDIGDYDTFNIRVGSSYQSASPVQEVDSNYTAGQVDVGDINGDVPEYLQRPEEQETIKGFVPAFKQGSDALYQGMKSSVGETANLLAGSSRDYTKAQRQLQELVDSGYDLTGFDKEKALKDYKDRQFQRDMDSWEEMMQQRRKEREGMGFLDALVHKFKDPDRPRDQYDSSAVAFNKMKVGDEVQLGRAFDAIQEALTQANGDVEKAYTLLGEQSAKETWGDKTSREAREAMREFKPTEGTAAWVGNIVPQMIGNVAGIAASVSPWTRWLARPLGIANLGMLTASSSGSAMADAREYAEQTGKQVSEGDVLRVGAISGTIEAGTEMLPYGRFFGGIHNSVAKKLGKEVTNAIAGNPAARRELSSLLRDAGSELSTKLFTKEAGKRFIGDVSIEGFSEFLAEGGGTLVPMIYQNPEDYPTLYEVLQNGWEGAKAGIFMGSILGGASSTIGHYQNRARRKQQGKMMLADTKDGVLEVVGQTGEDKYMAVDGEGMPHEITRDMVNDFEVVDFQEFDTYCKAQTEENLQKAVENGRSLAEDMDRTKKHAAKLELDKASRGLTPEMIEEMDGVSPTDYLASHEDVAEQVLPYLNAKAKYEGLIQGVREGIDGKIEQSNTYIDKNTHTDGRIYSARLKVDDEPVSIVSGDVALDENGLIDKERSAGRFIVMNSKGELQMRDRDDILSVDGISDAHEMKLTTAETIRQQEAQRAADEIEGKREFVQGEEVETYLNGMRVLVGVQAQNEDGTITVTDGKNEILTTREELQRGVDIVEQMRIDEELAAEQQGNDLASSDGMEDTYALNTELSFQTENGVVRGSVTNERNADGLIEVWTEEPLNGKKVNLFTEEELNALLDGDNTDKLNKESGVDLQNLSSEILQRANVTTDNGARNTINSNDSKIEGGLILNNLPQVASTIDSHGIAKGNELEHLLNFLINGVDTSRRFDTAPLGKASHASGSGLGTASGTSYRDGLFIIASKPNSMILDADGKTNISTVLINDMSYQGGNPLGESHAKAIQKELSNMFPKVDFVLYSEANDYYSKTAVEPAQNETPEQKLQKLIETLPKKKDGKVDYKALTPQQQFEYTSAVESPEMAIEDLKIYMSAKSEELEKLNARLTKAIGGERAEIRDLIRDKKHELDELSTFYQSVVSEQTEEIGAKEEDETPRSIMDVDMLEWTAENSTDLNEVITAYNEAKQLASHDIKLQPWEQALLGRKVSTDSFVRFSDKNHITGQLAKAWLRKDGVGIDQIQKEFEMEGLNVSEQDIVDFMLRHPSNYVRTTSDTQNSLGRRFSEIATKQAGMPIGGPESVTGKLFLQTLVQGKKLEGIQQAIEKQATQEDEVMEETFYQSIPNDALGTDEEIMHGVLDGVEYIDGEYVFNDAEITAEEIDNIYSELELSNYGRETETENSQEDGITNPFDEAREIEEPRTQGVAAEEDRETETGNSGTGIKNAFSYDKIVEIQEGNQVDEYDRLHGTQIGEMLNAIDAIQSNDTERKQKYNQRHFRINKTSDFLKSIGVKGDYFTVRTGVISRHINKDGSHGLGLEEWKDVAMSLSSPFAVTKYDKKDNAFRIWTNAKINNSYIVVGVDVKVSGKDMFVNSISTAFGLDNTGVSKDKIVWYDEKNINPAQRSVLNGLNSQIYPEAQGLFYGNKDNEFQEEKQISSQETIAKAENQKVLPDLLPAQEDRETETGNSGTGIDYTGSYTLSGVLSDNGERFYQDINGNINLVQIPLNVFEAIHKEPAPFRLIPSMLSHVFDRHGKEMKLQNAADAIKFVLDVMNNFDHVRQGESKALIFSVENGRNRIGQRAITVLLDSKNGEYYGIKTSGYERLDGLRKRALLWEKGANETSTTDVASVNVTTAKAQQGNELSGSASNQSNALSDNKNSEFQEEKQISSQETIAKAEQEVDSSPSEAQKEAGNYRKGHVKIDGFDITIENPKGSVRSGVDGDGKPWSVTMNNTYGYIRGTEGVDGDHIDIFLGEHMEAPYVYVVDQVKQDGSFDEHKVMYGFNSALAAKRAYLKNYSAGWKGLGNITGVSKEVFREWIDSSHRKTKPFNEYKSVRGAVQSEVRQRAEQTEAVVTSNESEMKDAGIFTVEDVNAIKNNPLTVEEIESAAVEPELKTLAKDYLAGNESFINLVAYQNIYNNVRNRTRGIEPNSTGASETQLDEVINGNQGGLESGFGRGEVDNVGAEGSETPVSRRGRSGKTGTEQPTLFDGERSDHEVRGEEPAVDGVSPGRGYSDGSGSAGGNGRDVSRPARGKTGSRGTKNDTGRRTNAEHERVDAVDKSSVSVDADLQSALDDFKDILHQFGKAGKNDMSLSLVGLNKEQIQLLPRLVSSGVKLGYQLIRKEVYDFKKWAEQMRSFIGDPLKQAIGYSDTDVNAFIREMWNSKFEIDGEVHTLAEWSAKLGTKELKRQVSATLEEKRAQQMAAESIPVKIADAQNIDETLPYLLPQQREDVRLAEVQFFDDSHQDREHGHGKGYLFTNGTGTGKTYTGLGIVKRFIKQGKNRILVVTPSQPKVTDWMKDATNLGIELRDLDTLSKEKGTTATTEKGEGAVITTFANLRQNKALLEDTFDLIVYDESHRIMENKQGEATIGADVHFMITNRNTNDALRRYSVINPKYQAWQKAQELYKKEMESSRLLMQHAGDNEIGAKGDEYAKRLEDAKAAMQLAEKEWEEEEKRLKPLVDNAVKTTKTVFLSATPFNTRESLSYAEGYIFSYPKENTNTVGSYHHHSPQTEFYLTHFGAGYKFRYGRLERGLTNADALVKQEIAFSDYLENELGTKSGRIIDSEYDYSRDFPMVTLKRAQDINDAIECVWREDALSPLSDALRQVWFNYNYTSALLETMKISATIPRIREHLKMGRKVVVFHRRVQSKAALNPPFKTMLSIAREQMRSESNAEAKKKLQDAITLFEKRHEGLLQYEQTLDYSMPREQIAEAFGAENVLFFSGKESGKTKNKAVETFNDDDSGKNIIVIQEASGKEGISLHDTSGKHQRVLITLALPQSPITALQIEGRIYRIGNKSNAIFEYPLLGLDSEMILFGQQFNQQVSTTENLALGSKARDLRSSFTRGVEEHTNVPLEQQGFGGKEFDKGKMEMADPFEDAVLDYYGNQKVKGRRDNREGMDYFATPEPVGFKMVEWAMPQEGETALEPSAGHGAIARYVSRDVSLTAIEPSSSLFGKLQLKAGGMGRKFVNDLFENYAVQNKHDVIVMNPPFGAAGKKAMDHLEKAFDHLTEGGRVVALIPHGQMDKRFEKWYGEKKEAVVTAEINLPPCTFEQAGTSVYARIVVIDRIGREETRQKAPYRRNIDLSGIKTVKELFERLKDVEVPGRTIDEVARNMKNAKKTVKEFKEIKGVDVVVDTDGVYAYSRSGMTLFSQRFDSESMANIPNEYARMHYWIEANGTVDMGNRSKERIEVYVTGMKTLRNLTGKTHEQLMEESKDGKSVLPAENTMRADATSEQQRSGDKYSYKEDRNTKTGEVMHLAIPLSKDLDRELYLQMVACAKRNDGYWNRFKKAFHFQTKEGADRFIKESATIGEDGNIRFRIHDDDVNERFNEELSRYKDGRMKSNEMFHLGTPQGAMLAFLPDLPIVMHQRTVRKGIEKKHNVDVNMLKDMPSMIASPIFVFQRDVKNIGILTEMVDRDGKNVCVAIEMNKTIQDGTNILEVNDIRSFHGREVENIIKPIRDNGTLRWVDKEKGIDWITSALHNFKQAQSSQNLSEEDFSSVTKIVESFENPTIEQGKIVSEVENLADELQTTVRVVKSIEELPEGNLARKRIENGDGIKGWFDTKSEEMAIFLPNAKSVEDARATVFHEVVAHKGLRGLLGKEFAPFLDRTYKDLSESVRREVVELSKKHGWDLRVGMEEYMARLAERGFADRESSSVWNKIKNAFMDAVHRLKIELGFRLRDNDLRYILWKSYRNLKGGNGILEQAQDIAFQMELGVGRFRKETDGVFTLGSKTDDAGNKFYEDGDGNIDLWTLPNDLFIEIGRQSAPIRLTEYNINHIIERHGKQIGNTEKEVINFIGAIFDSYTDIRKDGRTLFVTVENRETGKAALIRLFPSKYGDYYNVETAGYYQNSHLKKKELLWNESEPRNVATEPTDTLTGLSHKSAGNAIDTVSQNNSSSANVENKTDNTKSNEENIKSRSASLNSGSESVYLQQTNNNDNVSESISQRINGKMSKEDSRIEEALSKCKRGGEQDAKNAREAGRTLSERQQKEVEARVMEKYAKDNGMWIPMQDVFSLGIPAPSGNENDVYLDSKDNSVYKVNNLMNSKKISSLLERIKLHNLFFPQTKYELAGFSGFGSSDVYPVLKQDYIVNSTFATPEDIDAYMNKLGFKQIGEAAYSNGEYVISDLRPRNVLKDADGDIYVVDADFKSEGSDKGGGIRFRDSDSSSGEAMREYEGAVKTNLYKFQEAYQDSMLGLLKLQESVVNETKTDLADNENAYMAENQLSSKNAYEMEFYKDRFFKPMMDAVKGFIKHGRSYEDVKEYMMAKSGLERNEVFAMRDAQRKMDERMKELETLLDINAISEEEYEEMRAMAEEQRDLDYAENRERDYSGLSSLMADTEQYEEMAQELVDNFEEGNEKAVAELWKRVNDATKSTLLKTYKSGMMTKGVYDHVKGMFEYYIPMRGWTEDVAADVYDYILSERSPFNAPVKAAQGRTSLADDPLATIGNMAESAIMQGNRNMMKQKFLNLVENHPTSLATVQKVWYENMGTKEEPVWEQSFPDIPENANADEVAVAIEEHEARMKELKKNGMAKDERNGVNLKYRASKREMNEHIVVVKRGGREYAVYVNGNPRAAQAINGLTNPDTIEHKGVKLVQRLNRQLAANFTTRNPAFVLSNLSRDLIFSTTAVAIKEKGKYARKFNANIVKNTLGMVKLMKRYQDGKLDMGKERDRLFKEFLENGGETGYTALHSVDEYKKLIDREVMDAKGKVDLGRVFGLKPGKVTTSTTLGIVPAFQFMSKWTEFGNRCAEDVSRFTAYMTSRQEGRSVQRSIADAKEITVNFNKKGAGGYGATTFKSLYLFFNAGVQSLNNFYRLAKGNPKKFNLALLGFTAAGVLLPMLNEFLIDMWGDDDDKDKYDNLPEWVRRNNFCFWLGDDRFVTIPLPIELRAFYGMGEIFNQWTKGNMKHKNVGYELVNQITELIPLNPLGGNGDVVSSFVPDAGKPFYQVMTNKDYFGKPIYKETDFNVLMPEFTKAYRGTSSALVASSELLNEVTGGDKYTRGWANVNPAKVEHVFEGYFGGMGKTINQLGKTIGMIWDEDQRVMRNVPVVNRFLNGTDDRNAFSRVNEEYYHYLEEFRETEQRLKGYEKEADLGIMEYAEKVNFLEYSKEYQRYEIFKDYQKELKELQTEIKEAVDKDERRFLENQLNFVKMELVKRLNEMED